MGRINELNDFTRGQLDAALMKIGQDAGMGTAEGIRAFLRGELSISSPPRSWREEDGVIYFSVTPDGADGETWITLLEGNIFLVEYCAKEVLRSPSFKSTNGVTTEVAVLKGMLFEDQCRITELIRAHAEAFRTPDKRKLEKPNAELACLIRRKFTDKEIEAMGLTCIVAMHEPINDSDGNPGLLSARRDGGGRWLNAYNGRSDCRWGRDHGFAFAVSQARPTE
ncbi:MAG: hypothetical protein LiPW30_361 [Parcubacteria group bacterium LiPW_30]|nr:MAG: hypothetical protein LiPW30_361 [Parcubacteria group bacterium LiPW_30]